MAATTDRRLDAPAEGPGPDDIEPVAHETRDRFITGTVTVRADPRCSASSPGSCGTTLLHWQRPRSCSRSCTSRPGSASRSASTASSRTAAFKTGAAVRGDARRARLDRDRGPGHLVGRRPPQAPRLLRPAGRPAQPARRPRRRLARRAARPRCTRTSAGCSSTPSAARKTRYAPDLIADPVVSLRRPHVPPAGSLAGLRRAVRARLADRRHARRRPDRAAVGRRGADARPAPRDLQHQLAVPLLRAPALRHRRRVAQPRVAVALHVRRGVAQQPPRVPDLGRATACGRWQFDPSALGHLGAGEDRPRLGRRADQPGAQARKAVQPAQP